MSKPDDMTVLVECKKVHKENLLYFLATKVATQRFSIQNSLLEYSKGNRQRHDDRLIYFHYEFYPMLWHPNIRCKKILWVYSLYLNKIKFD